VTTLTLVSPLAGFALSLAEVPDPVFAGSLAGDGVAIDPTDEILHAPCDGEVVLMPAGRHALTLKSGVADVLLHVGIDTVRLNGRGFELLVGDGARVQAGEPLLRFSLDEIVRAAKSAVTPVLISGPPGATVAQRVAGRAVAVGDFLMQVQLPAAHATQAPAAAVAQRRVLTVPFEHGLHARPAALVVNALKGLAVEVGFTARGRRASGRSVVALMSLGVHAGDCVEVAAEGADAAAALEALEALLPPARKAAPAEREPAAVASLPGTVRGVVAARGFAVGVAVPLVEPERAVSVMGVGVREERRALTAAIDTVRGELQARLATASGAQRDILEAHAELVADPELALVADESIAQGKSAAYSFRRAVRSITASLAALDDALLRERAADLRDLERQVVAVLLGEPPRFERELPERAIVVADEVLPSQLIGLAPSRLAGMVMSGGGPTSHVAIIAAAMGVPALVGAGDAVLAIAAGTPLVLDADAGELHVDPAPAVHAAATARMAARAASGAREIARAHEPAITVDTVRIAVCCNVGSAAEAAAAIRQGAEGCGLLRTEFLFLDRREPPDEAEQAAAYQAVAAALEGRPLSIRTLDAGGDKPIAYLPMPREDNPALGLRGLRTSLARHELLATQLRAILRVAAGPCRILLPMVTELGELRAVRAALAAERRSLGPGPTPPLGVMIETPASALLAEQLAAEADFLSVGTNDLAQYTLAMDRTHPELGGRLDALHPAVLRLIERAAVAARRNARTLSVCGALASDPVAVPVLLGLGVRELSAVPAMIPRLKALLRSIAVADCELLAAAALELASAKDVRELARDWQAAHGLTSEVA
jgi:phosphoenolpyruvate-protein phosphotransferase